MPAKVVEKICRVCGGEPQPLDNFYDRPGSKDGKRSECKSCTKARSRQSVERDPEHRKAYMREYDAANREKLRKQARERARLTQRKFYFRRYRRENYEAVTANERRYRTRNRVKETARRHQRRALGMDATAREYIVILHRDPCAYCGGPATTIDHIIPVVAGGTNAWGNLTSACLSCNASKNDRSLLTHLMETTNAK